MKVSYNWLQTFFDTPLPSVSELADKLTFHSSEVEGIIEVAGDSVMDVKVLPDKSAWLLSHRGIAKEVAAILGRKLKYDPLMEVSDLAPSFAGITLTLESPDCDYYSAALITGVTVGPSPVWLQDRLKAIGQRPINNVVDAANYVMFEMGQPLHAFDADKLGQTENVYSVGVRTAVHDEHMVTLMGEEVILTKTDMVVVDATTNIPIAIAGVKGGMAAVVDDGTTILFIESAHFDRVAVRKTAQRYGLRTDASQRYENGVPRALAPLGLKRVCTLLTELTGGTVVGFKATGKGAEERHPVRVHLSKINSVLGLTLDAGEVAEIIERLGYQYIIENNTLMVTPPFERDDLILPEDLVEEVGRLYGLTKISAISPEGTLPTEINVRHVYAERIRTALIMLGFSEVMTSSFREHGEVKIKNALASDKGYLRSNLTQNLKETLIKNAPHRDLLGLSSIQIFEFGTVFTATHENYTLALGVRNLSEYKAKVDDQLLIAAQTVVEAVLGQSLSWSKAEGGVTECQLSEIFNTLPTPLSYDETPAALSGRYQAFSMFPAVSRDIAFWVTEGSDVPEITTTLRKAATVLCLRITHIDTFTKEGRTSHAFRIVFQSMDRTLVGEEVDEIMKQVADAVEKSGGQVR